MKKEESQAPDAEKSKKKPQKQCKICYIGKNCGIFFVMDEKLLADTEAGKDFIQHIRRSIFPGDGPEIVNSFPDMNGSQFPSFSK